MLVTINNRSSTTLISFPPFFSVFGAGPLSDPNVYQQVLVAVGVLLLLIKCFLLRSMSLNLILSASAEVLNVLRDNRIQSGNFSDTSVMRVVSTRCCGWNPRTGPAETDTLTPQLQWILSQHFFRRCNSTQPSARDLDGQFHGSQYTTVTILFFFFFFYVCGLGEPPILTSDTQFVARPHNFTTTSGFRHSF